MCAGVLVPRGQNSYGQLGDNSTVDRNALPSFPVITDVTALAAGASFTCALMSSTGLRCWGSNNFGQLCDGSTISTLTPPLIDTLTGVAAIAAGNEHMCVLMLTGSLRCYGSNNFGQVCCFVYFC